MGREVRMVSDKSFIMVDAVEYSAPTEYKNRQVEIFKTETDLFVFNDKTDKEITTHKISLVSGKRIIKREHFRDNSRNLSDLRQQTLSMYEFSNWKEYVKLNIKAYPRYVRDQLIYAEKHLKEVEDVSILERAVLYCQENKTYSMTQLKDTYEYQLREHRDNQKTISNLFQGLHKKISCSVPEVATRSVGEYENLVSPLKGGMK